MNAVGRSRHVIACTVFLAAALAVLGDVLLAGTHLVLSMPNEDMTRPFFYWFPFAFGQLRQGHLVLWNPHNYAGAPYFGGFGPALLYPPNWLHMALPTAVAINLGITLHLFLAGLWVYCWTLHRRLHPAACVLAGVVFMFSGAVFLQIYRGHLHCLTTLTWTPLVFLAIDGVLEPVERHAGSSIRWVVLGMVAVAMQIFAGHVQYIFYTAMIAGTYALAGWLTVSRRIRDAVALLAIYVGGACLAAVQLFTGLQAATESFRTGISYDVAASFAFPPENLVTLIFPGLFGDMVGTPYWGRWTLTEMSLFIGVAPFLLAVCGVIAGAREHKRFSLVMVLLVLILAFGDYTPLFHVLYDHAPGFQNFRGTTKFIFLAVLFLAMLVAVGLDYLLRVRVPRWLVVVALASGAALLVTGTAVRRDCMLGGEAYWLPALNAMRFFEDAYRDFVQMRGPGSMRACFNVGQSLSLGGGTFALVGLLLLAARSRRGLIYVIAAIGVVEVMAYARYTRPTFDPTSLSQRSATLRRLLDEQHAGDARLASHDPYSYVAMGAGAFDLWGADPTVLGRYARFLALTQGWPVDAIVVTAGIRTLSPLLGMLRLRYLLGIGNDEQVILRPTGLRELPRALLVSHWRVLPDGEQVLGALGDAGFDPEHVVLLEKDPGLAAAESEEKGTITLRDVSTEVIEITADVLQPSILLITDNYSASWKATPLDAGDTKTYEVVPGNYLLRAIPLTVGHHHFRLEYHPTALLPGTLVTLLTMATCAVALRGAHRRSSRAAGLESHGSSRAAVRGPRK